MGKADFVQKFIQTRAAFLSALAGLTEAEAGQTADPAQDGGWPSLKDIIGHVAAWEREVLIADEMIKRGEESHLDKINREEFNQAQATHRRGWSLEQVRSELDLNYEALLMAWDEYEDEDGPFGPSTWLPAQPGSLWWLLYHLRGHGQEIARRRHLAIPFPLLDNPVDQSRSNS